MRRLAGTVVCDDEKMVHLVLLHDPRKRYAQISDVAVDALKRYAEEVRSGKFPDADHSYGMNPEEQEKLARLLHPPAARSRSSTT